MSATTAPTTDRELQSKVEDELNWDPSIAPASIGVSAHNHTVTLSGTVDRYTTRLAAVSAAKRVQGVQSVADDIAVEPAGSMVRSDHDLAEYVQGAMRWSTLCPGSIQATVREGIVTLDGVADHNYQRVATQKAVLLLSGVRGIRNNIKLKSTESPADIHERIAAALRRRADVEADTIQVTAAGGEVHLNGTVASWSERDSVLDAAWAAEGVTTVVDNLRIRS